MSEFSEMDRYTFEDLLRSTGNEWLMDLRGGINDTFQLKSDSVYRLVEQLEQDYEESFVEPWDLEYSEEEHGYFMVLEKEYHPQKSESFEVEIRGTADIDLEEFLETH